MNCLCLKVVQMVYGNIDGYMQPMPKMFDNTSWPDMQKAIIEKVKLLQ